MASNLLNYEVDPFNSDTPAYLRVQSVEYSGTYPDVTADAAANYPPTGSYAGSPTRLFIEFPYIIDISDTVNRAILFKDITTATVLTRVTGSPGANEYRVSPTGSNRRSIIEVAIARAGNQFGYDMYVIGSQLKAEDAGKLTGNSVKLAIAGGSYNENLSDALIGSAADAGAVINTWITTLNTAGGGTIYLAEGTYLISTTILPKDNVSIIGNGASTILKRNAAITYIINANTNSADNYRFAHFTLDGNKATYTGTYNGIRGSSGGYSISCQNLIAKNNDNYGFDVCHQMKSCLASDNDEGYRDCSDMSACKAVDNALYGIRDCKRVSLCLASSNDGHGFYDCDLLSTCYSAGNQNSGDGYNTCNGVVNCYAWNNDGAGYEDCTGMGHNAAWSNTAGNFLTSYADYGGTAAVADTAAGGWNATQILDM